ncbi:MAG: hypothetical protein J1F11_07805 [Oscillospiraceae bacterium]|nr:hypothetical protein [Oscillospiraceae bacterium]
MKKKIIPFILCAAAAAVYAAGCTRVSEEAVGDRGEAVSTSFADFVSPVYESLSDEEKALYDKVKDAAANFADYVEFDEPIPRELARKIYKLVYDQERKYFWLSNIFYAPDSEVSILKISYIYSKEDAEMKKAELDVTAEGIIGELPDGATDFDRIVYFHDRIVTGCDFAQKREHVNSAYGVLVNGYGQCEGYAAAMSLLCDKSGIPNYTVCGTNENGDTHAWNKVLLNGQWYNADCTWDDPILTRNDPDFVRHDYLLVTDEEIEGITHFTDELYAGMPPCTAESENYFAGRKLVYYSASDAADAMREQIKAAGLLGKREAELRMSEEGAYFSALARLFDSGEIKEMIEDINGEYGTKIRSAYKHNNDTLFIVHISLIYESDVME